MSDFLLADLHALTDMGYCSRRTDWCDGTVCLQWGGCPLADPYLDSEVILRAHDRAMHSPGTMARDLLEFGLIQADECFLSWIEDDAMLPRLRLIDADPDDLAAVMADLMPWMPLEAGW